MLDLAQLATVMVLASSANAPTVCPAPEAVEAALLPSSVNLLRDHRERLVLSVEGDTVGVQLIDAAGERAAERSLATDAPCDVRAAALATLVDAMLIELHGSPPRIDLPTFAPEPVAEPGASEVVARSPQASHSSVGVELGAAFLASLSGETLAPAAELTVEIAPPWAGFRLRTAAFVEGTRSLAIGAGSAGYQRSFLTLGPAYRLGNRKLWVELGLSTAGALLSLRGDGITSAASALVLEAGGGADVAARWSLGSWAAWLGLFAFSWPASPRVTLAALGESRSLPSWEGFFGGGIQFTAL